MWLPTPSDEAFERFRELVLAETGMDLTPKEARESATRFLQLSFIVSSSGERLRDRTEEKRTSPHEGAAPKKARAAAEALLVGGTRVDTLPRRVYTRYIDRKVGRTLSVSDGCPRERE